MTLPPLLRSKFFWPYLFWEPNILTLLIIFQLCPATKYLWTPQRANYVKWCKLLIITFIIFSSLFVLISAGETHRITMLYLAYCIRRVLWIILSGNWCTNYILCLCVCWFVHSRKFESKYTPKLLSFDLVTIARPDSSWLATGVSYSAISLWQVGVPLRVLEGYSAAYCMHSSFCHSNVKVPS